MYPNLKAGLPEKNWKDPEKFKKRNELKLVMKYQLDTEKTRGKHISILVELYLLIQMKKNSRQNIASKTKENIFVNSICYNIPCRKKSIQHKSFTVSVATKTQQMRNICATLWHHFCDTLLFGTRQFRHIIFNSKTLNFTIKRGPVNSQETCSFRFFTSCSP